MNEGRKLKIESEFITEKSIPVLALRGFVAFPGIMLHFEVGRKQSVMAVEQAMNSDRHIFLVTQREIEKEIPKPSDLYNIGVFAKVRQILKKDDSSVHVLLEGICRAEATQYIDGDKFLTAKISKVESQECEESLATEALIRKVEELVAEYLSISPRMPSDVFMNLSSHDGVGEMSDYIVSNIHLRFEDKQKLLEELDPIKRMERLIVFLSHENEILKYEYELGVKLKDTVDKAQREYFLKEQIRLFSKELGEGTDPITEADEYRKKLKKLKLSKDTYEKLNQECDNFAKVPVGSSEANIIRTYLDMCFSLPWNKSSKETIDIKKAQAILDRDHFGLKKVKERILEFLAVKKLAPDVKGQIICLVGPPGVGKTSIAKSLAEAIGRKYIKIALGGVNDESEIRGHRKTYIGAMPGRIISAIKQVKVNNPLILLDEIDKLSKDYHGDPSAALLEALDPEQNCEFYDRYIEVPFDLSKVFFIATANDKDEIPEPLYDRMEVIELGSYTHEEKFNIARDYLIPKQLKRNGLSKKTFAIDDDSIKVVIEKYTKEAGVRELERNIASLMRKSAKKIVEGSEKSLKVDLQMVKKLLGTPKYKNEKIDINEFLGVAQGLAWTSVGGEMLPIEVVIMKGKGDIQITGSLGDVMKESVQLAISYMRCHASKLGIRKEFHKNWDIHIHAPEGAVPKDGPSAGVTVATALLSCLANKPVKKDVAMTGEITLKGNVIPVGGLKEKITAAYVNGVKTVIIPSENESDLDDIDEKIKKSINFIKADNLATVFKYAIQE